MESIIQLIQIYPRISIIVFALIVSFFISLINFFVLDKERMHEIKKKQKDLQAQAKLHKDNPEKLMQINKEMMEHAMESMRHSFKPMLITMIPIIFLFTFLKNSYAGTSISGSWFWYYLIASIFGSIIFRKLFKLP